MDAIVVVDDDADDAVDATTTVDMDVVAQCSCHITNY